MFRKLSEFIVKPLLSFIYPEVCIICKNRIEGNEFCVCINCWLEFKECESTSKEFILFSNRIKSDNLIKNFIALYIFEREGKFQEAIHYLKYKNVKSIGFKLGEELGKKLNKKFGEIDIITSVPLHKLKERERGYNQADFICKGISKVTGYHFIPNILRRIKYTQTQTELNFQQRKENVENAFCINNNYRKYIKDKNVLLVDDVITTGATIIAAANVLKQTEAKCIYIASAGLAAFEE